jgi:hypothetical protein
VGTVLRTGLEHLEYLESQRSGLDQQIDHDARREPYRTLVEALCCLRGVQTLTAMILATEIGDVRRFRSPGALLSWVGLIPSVHASGDRERRGPITKTGNAQARRVLIQSAWNHRHRCGASLIVNRRRMGQPPEVVAIALRAQHRLSPTFRRLARRKHPNTTVTAVARELCGFVWAMMQAVPQPTGRDTARDRTEGRAAATGEPSFGLCGLSPGSNARH